MIVHRISVRRPILLVLLVLAFACTREEPVRPDCMINEGPCVRTIDGLTVSLAVSPRPVRAMRDLEFDVLLLSNGDPVADASLEIDLTMPGMQMGENRLRLQYQGRGRYHGSGVIVRCPSGRTVWKASVAVDRYGRVMTADYLFDAP